MTQKSIDCYRRELEEAKQNKTFGCTNIATKILSKILDNYTDSIKYYLKEKTEGKAVRGTLAADVISRLNDVDAVAYISAKIILNSVFLQIPSAAIYKSIGQGIEDEYKMRTFKEENSHYYETIQEDLNKRGAKANRKKNITTGVFNKRLEFHLENWSISEKFQTGLVLSRLFVESTGLVEIIDEYKKNKHYKTLVPAPHLVDWIEVMNEKLEVLQPFFLPMVCKPKEWTGIFEGGYISPYLKKNKLIKNNDKKYLKQIGTAQMPLVYEAINHLQNTEWQINKDVLKVVMALWEEGRAIAELPDREDEALIPYPYSDKTQDDPKTDEELEVIKKWKRDTYEIHKRNVQKRSLRILVAQILRIAEQFKDYDKIWFPHQMDFRGRLYPIPVLLNPQGTDLAKGLLRFANGKSVDKNSIEWLEIHGANVYGYDKESYEDRIKWTRDRAEDIRQYANNPLQNRGWSEADKPFQFLAFCFEYNSYLSNPECFRTHIPVQLDGTCNGLQHYSALLRDAIGGKAVNLTNADKPNDIYATVADKLEEKLKEIINNEENNCKDSSSTNSIPNSTTRPINKNRNTSSSSYIDSKILAECWLNLGINRKLTKRPVMVLPYGGTILACREYIQEYLTDTYSPNFIWTHFGVGANPTDCMFKVSVWLSKILWQAIQETLNSAIVGMAYLRKVASLKAKQPIEWLTPIGLLIKQAYPTRKKSRIRTELHGSLIKVTVNISQNEIDHQRQLNGICPNFIHSLDATALMIYLNKCKEAGINSFMTVHDCYGTLAPDTELSAKLLREAFVEIYRQPILEKFTMDVLGELPEDLKLPDKGQLDIEDVLDSSYFFN